METFDARSQRVPLDPHFRSAPRRAADEARPNFYSNPHKALRLAMADTLAFAGRVDPDDDGEVAALSAQVRSLLDFCRVHLEKEEEFVHPALEARRRGSSAETHAEHRHHLAACARLDAHVGALEAAAARGRASAAAKLYDDLALFVADNLLHMRAEETANNETLWDCYSDEELAALEQRLVASIPPEQLRLALRWMVPAMNPAERAALLRGIRAHAPAAAFDAILAGAEAGLGEADRGKLARALAA